MRNPGGLGGMVGSHSRYGEVGEVGGSDEGCGEWMDGVLNGGLGVRAWI